jgi:hypothetical protein
MNSGWNGRVTVYSNGTPVPLFQPTKADCPSVATSILIIANEANGGNMIVGPADDVDATEASRVGAYLLEPGYAVTIQGANGRAINLEGYWVDSTADDDQLRWVIDEGVEFAASSVVLA